MSAQLMQRSDSCCHDDIFQHSVEAEAAYDEEANMEARTLFGQRRQADLLCVRPVR